MELALICTWCLRHCYINGCTKSSGMSSLLHISFISVNLSITKLFSTDSISITIPTYTAALFLYILSITDLNCRIKYFRSFHTFFLCYSFLFLFCVLDEFSAVIFIIDVFFSLFILSISFLCLILCIPSFTCPVVSFILLYWVG